MSPKVKSLVQKRNKLRKQISTHRKEWLETCREVTAAKAEAKHENWKEIVSSSISDTNERGMWKLIKSLNGSPNLNSPNEAMTIKGKKVISSVKKAEAFVSHYAKVSKLKLSRPERSISRKLKRRLRSRSSTPTVPPFTLEELKSAIANMRRRGAPGPDNIPQLQKRLQLCRPNHQAIPSD